MSSWALRTVDSGIELYLAPNFEKLQEMVNVKSTVSPDKIGNTLRELERRANLARLDGDHEMTYVYLMRYIGIAIDAKKRKLSNLNIETENLAKMMNLADLLSSSLRARYHEKQLSTATNGSANGEGEPGKPDSSSESIGSVKENKEPAPSSKPGPQQPAPQKTAANVDTDVWINSKDLYALMKTGRTPDELLIIDCRSAEEYASAHIDFPGSLNVPEDLLKPGTACSKLERLIATETSSKLFFHRKTAKNIVIVDWESGDDGNRKRKPNPSSAVWCMYLALTKWNDSPIVATPKILLKGYNNFLLLYKQHTTGKRDIQAVKRQVDDDFRKPLQQVSDYPDLEDILGVPTAKRSSKQQAQSVPNIPLKPAHMSPLAHMSIPTVDRSKKPSLNKPSLPSQPMTTSTMSSIPAVEAIVESKPQPMSNEVNELDTATKNALQAEIKELEDRKRQQLKELAEVMRAKRNVAATPAVPNMPPPHEVVTSAPIAPTMPSPTGAKTLDELDGAISATAKESSVKPESSSTVSQQPHPEVPAPSTSKPARVRARSHSAEKTAPVPQPSVDRSKKPDVRRPQTIAINDTNNSGSSKLQQDPSPHIPRTGMPSTPTVPTRQISLPFHDNSADFTSLQPIYGPTASGTSGLRNMGNTCFLSSVIQCLAAAPAFSDYFVYSAYKDAVCNRQKLLIANGMDPATYRQPLTVIEMARVLKAMLSSQYRSLAPRDLKAVIGSKNSTFATSKQQDAQEFLAELLDTLHEDINISQFSVSPKNDNNRPNEEEPTNEKDAWQIHRRHHESIMVGLFHGLLKSTVTCLTCHKSFPKFDAFVYLTLPVPTGERGKITIHDCLASYVYPEFIDGWRCSNCKKPSRVTKKLDIVKPPPLLIVHLNRFAWSGEWRAKITDPVHFQVDGFVLGSRSYSLFAICNHFGTLEAGHYTATTRPSTSIGRPPSTFFRYDDAEVSSLSASQLVTDERHAASAYLLFYAARDVDWSRYRHDLMGAAKL